MPAIDLSGGAGTTLWKIINKRLLLFGIVLRISQIQSPNRKNKSQTPMRIAWA